MSSLGYEAVAGYPGWLLIERVNANFGNTFNYLGRGNAPYLNALQPPSNERMHMLGMMNDDYGCDYRSNRNNTMSVVYHRC